MYRLVARTIIPFLLRYCIVKSEHGAALFVHFLHFYVLCHHFKLPFTLLLSSQNFLFLLYLICTFLPFHFVSRGKL